MKLDSTVFKHGDILWCATGLAHIEGLGCVDLTWPGPRHDAKSRGMTKSSDSKQRVTQGFPAMQVHDFVLRHSTACVAVLVIIIAIVAMAILRLWVGAGSRVMTTGG